LDIERLFGTIPRSMITLIAFYTYDSSMAVQRVIGEVYPWAWIFFLVFMVVVSIGVMELMTSLFIDSLMEEKKRVESKQADEKDRRRKEVQALIKGLFEAFDEDKSETLDKNELQDCLAVFDDPDTKALLDYVQIDANMMRAAIKVADIDGDEEVSADEFSAALESIHEPPKKSDIREVHQRVGHLQRDVAVIGTRQLEQNPILQDLQERMGKLEGLLLALVQGTDGGPPGPGPSSGPTVELAVNSSISPTIQKLPPSLPPLPQSSESSAARLRASSSASPRLPAAPPPLPTAGSPAESANVFSGVEEA